MSVSVCLSVCLSACVCMCVCVRLSVRDHMFGTARPIFIKFFLCMLRMAVARSSSGGVVISNVLPVLWMTIFAKVAQRRRPAKAQRTRSLRLDYKLCAVIPVAGQRTHGITFRALKVTTQAATLGGVCGLSALFIGASVAKYATFSAQRIC